MSERFNTNQRAPEAPGPDDRFNPSRDITQEQWEDVNLFLEDLYARGEWLSFVVMAARMEPLGGDPIVLTPDEQSKIDAARVDQDNPEAKFLIAACEKILGVDVQVSKMEVLAIEELIYSYRRDGRWKDFIRLASQQKILGFPVTLAESDISSIEKFVRNYGSNDTEISSYAAWAAILGITIPLLPEQLEAIRKERKKLAEGEFWDDFVDAGWREALLAADRIIIPSGGGLKLMFHQKES